VVKCGSYGAQSIASGSKASAVSFYAETYTQAQNAEDTFAATTCSTLASLSITTDKVHVTGIQATNGDVNAPNMLWELHIQDDGADFTDVVVDGWHGHGFGAYASGVTIRYGNFGKVPNICGAGYDSVNDNNDATRFWNNGAPSNNDSLIDSVVHDWLGPPEGQCGLTNQHTDCWQTPGGTNMVITGNLFYNCPTSDMQTGEFSGGLMGTFTISNNFFGPTEGSNNLSIGQGHCAGDLDREQRDLYARRPARQQQRLHWLDDDEQQHLHRDLARHELHSFDNVRRRPQHFPDHRRYHVRNQREALPALMGAWAAF
jgi:hypothetical protein